ncbi:peptidylprolyl isomerase SurA [Candidatus Steffania adelgidicola]|uniref:peptidylprolyl isomerase SurA n=1 Tax=Candidatus Steffania adelgidicola TaxID=1076626 RepID=UPI001D013D52|nr:peptidylprolyl isomerase SurA [Candidatus Steffania adelgidicola]UDG80218.1 Chaperone SurA [Candidatus Steffania adelgidicola]
MKKRKFILAFILCICTKGTFAAPQVLDKVLVVVNKDVILESDVKHMLTTMKLAAQDANQPLPDKAMLYRNILDRLIMNNIVLQLAQSANSTSAISDKQLDQTIMVNIAAEQHMTLDQLRRRLLHNGIDYEIYRDQIRQEILIAEIRNAEIRHRITILPEEVDSLVWQIAAERDNFAEFNLSHILIHFPKNPTEDQQDQVEAVAISLVKKIKNGADFSKLARIYSSSPQAKKGGLIGWRKFNELDSLFRESLKGMKTGAIVGPIRSAIGFHILKVNNKREGDQKLADTVVHTRHIFLRTAVGRTDQQALRKLKVVAAQIKSGRITFNAAAKQFSEDLGSMNLGGDLGWNSVNEFDPALGNVVTHLKKGEISTPVHSSFGWHLIQLLETSPVDKSESAKKERAYVLLFNRKFAEETEAWIQEQRTAAYVKIIDNHVE